MLYLILYLLICLPILLFLYGAKDQSLKTCKRCGGLGFITIRLEHSEFDHGNDPEGYVTMSCSECLGSGKIRVEEGR